ncbi:hypothetical protein ONR75_15755 [Rhodopseudomonas sp. P2A-2r]|uniref:hypothetical protein n=1 Tax=Rhodopseudomonas sp. P2A-2r TaxID=2991972 RepID=UPI002234AD5C|nr:hypothetical protein [Rhodopseudomonas sp. P2A-2r]UZE51886.1 hypothetical protein ONR75_15755 [Rhodopseudomonas sp. P2A-2r]
MKLVEPVDRRDYSGRDFTIESLWKLKRDTLFIAERMGIPESTVANRLALIRDAGRS